MMHIQILNTEDKESIFCQNLNKKISVSRTNFIFNIITQNIRFQVSQSRSPHPIANNVNVKILTINIDRVRGSRT